MKEHDIDSRVSKKWSEDDEQYLEEYYLEDSKQNIMARLDNRTWNAIKLKAMEMGVARSAKEYQASEACLQVLKQNAEDSEIKVAFDRKTSLSYVIGVIEGDGYRDKKGTFGLEVKSEEFAEKFISNLKSLGLNPSKGSRRGKSTVWASSSQLERWFERVNGDERVRWILDEGDAWAYIEGQYDSDGNLHPSGSPRICSYEVEEKLSLEKILSELMIDCNIQQNNVWVCKSSSKKFFENVECVLEHRMP
ncbi:hypothetical protein [Candidatus Nanohalococcus occultus]|uniref:hypothetical protein n=1 Tax=Candidatus Nanohalococcus occultus TaxID=2978047 RepID=UPI0039E0185E